MLVGYAFGSRVACCDFFLLCLPVLRLFLRGGVGGRMVRTVVPLGDACASRFPSSLSDTGSSGEIQCWFGSDWISAAPSPDSSSHESLRTMSPSPSLNVGDLPVGIVDPPGDPVQLGCSPGDLGTSTMGALVRMVHLFRLGVELMTHCCSFPLN